MTRKMLLPILIGSSCLLLTAAVRAPRWFRGAADNALARAYPRTAGGTWENGSDGFVSLNSGFAPWDLERVDTAGSYSGFEFGSSTAVAGGLGADIDTFSDPNQPVSFKLYGSGVYESAAFRDFNDPLSTGQTFSIDLAVNYRNGFKGIDVRDSDGANLFTFVICCDDYIVSNAATGNGSIGDDYSNNTAFHIELTQTSAAGGVWTVTRSGEIGDFDNGTYTGTVAGIKLFCAYTEPGVDNDLYVNNLAISGVGADDASASAYPRISGGTWQNWSDGYTSGPSAFRPWRLFSFEDAGSLSGFYFFSSTGVAGGVGADIDSRANDPVSFMMFGSGIWETAAYRRFGTPLRAGQDTFSIDMAVNFRNGFKGIDVRDPNDANLFTFVVCCDDYIVANAATNNGSIGDDYSNNTAFHLELAQTSAAGGKWTITRSGDIQGITTGTYSGVAASIKLFCANTDAGPDNDFYVNNLEIITRPFAPEVEAAP